MIICPYSSFISRYQSHRFPFLLFEMDEKCSVDALLTAVVVRNVVERVMDKMSAKIPNNLRMQLAQIWFDNMALSGGLPDFKIPSRHFSIDMERIHSRMTDTLPPVPLIGLQQRPCAYMNRPKLSSSSTLKSPLDIHEDIETKYVLKSVSFNMVVV